MTNGANRRKFLAAGAAAAAMPAFGACARRTGLPPGSHVVVVGAGFAGVGAAERLIDAGYTVDLIEARDRVGGRAHSVSLGGFPADLGANWLRLSDNDLLPFASERGLLGGKTDFESIALIQNGGRQVIATDDVDAEIAPALTGPFLRYQARRLFGARPQAQSAAALLSARLTRGDASACAAERLLRSVFAADLESLSGVALFENASTQDEAAAIEPTVSGGMQSLLEALMQRARPALGEPVSAIVRTGDGVEVKTNRRTVTADAVIVTVSIGVLKSGLIRFEPDLSARHRGTLDAMDMGAFAKLWLRYPDSAWPSGMTTLVPCDSADLDVIVDFSPSHGAPVLLGYATGRRARAIEALSSAEAQNMMHETVQTMFGVALPAPAGFIMNRWGADPYVRGAYMYPNTQFRAGDNLRLRAPIAERILLAGEALADTYGYVDTAWRDGRRAADLLIEGYSQR